jgi:hypothetical protein
MRWTAPRRAVRMGFLMPAGFTPPPATAVDVPEDNVCTGQVLLGEDLAGVAIAVARVGGIALVGLGLACWPGPPLVGILTYSAAVALYLAYVGFTGGLRGKAGAI